MRPTRLMVNVIAVLVIAILASTQPSAGQTKSPKAVVDEFWKMETQGGRLTPDGWKAADAYFVRPSKPPKDLVIGVVDNEYSIGDPATRTSNTATVTVHVGGLMWKIDPNMRISILSDQVKGFVAYELVLTGTHWESAPDRRTLREVSGEPEWRIEKEGDIWLTVDTAIRYLSHVRDTTSDPAIKRNADRSLATLRQRH